MYPWDIYKAMGDKTRLRILVLLTKKPLSVGEIAGILKISQPNVSRHLMVLSRAGLVNVAEISRHHIYSLIEEPSGYSPYLLQTLESLGLKTEFFPESAVDLPYPLTTARNSKTPYDSFNDLI